MLNCSDAELESLLEGNEVISAIRAAFAHGFEGVRMPTRSQIDLDTSTLIVMPCAIVGDPFWGMKVASVSKQPRAQGRVRSSYAVFCANSGEMLASFAANSLTDIRTATTTVLATDLLARADAKILGIFGTGRQAEGHLRFMSRHRRFERYFVCGSNRQSTKAFARKMSESLGVTVCAVDADECASESDVVCTCTTSATPLFSGHRVRNGTHVNLIGAFQPHAREIDSVLLRRARVFVDTYDGAFAEAGDILVPLAAGEIQREHVLADLHELTAGLKQGRTSPDDVTVFKSVGCALEDLVTAKLVMQKLRNGAGTQWV